MSHYIFIRLCFSFIRNILYDWKKHELFIFFIMTGLNILKLETLVHVDVKMKQLQMTFHKKTVKVSMIVLSYASAHVNIVISVVLRKKSEENMRHVWGQ